jgi:hypothetical protein
MDREIAAVKGFATILPLASVAAERRLSGKYNFRWVGKGFSTQGSAIRKATS